MSTEIKNLKDLQNTEYGLKKLFDDAEDFLPLLGTDYVELYVGNAKQSAHFYKTAFGFQSEAFSGLETGVQDKVSYVLKQDKIRLVLTTSLEKDGLINWSENCGNHGYCGQSVLAGGVCQRGLQSPLASYRAATSPLFLSPFSMNLVHAV